MTHQPRPKQLALKQFDAFEIGPVKEHDDFCEICAVGEEDYWTLYGHIPGEGVEAIADRRTLEDCEELLYRLTGHRDYLLNTA